MSIPDSQTLMRPVLESLSGGDSTPMKTLVAVISERYELTPEERELLVPSGLAKLVNNRVAWAVSHMYQAGLVARPERAQVQITEAGKGALAEHPERIDFSVLATYPSYEAFRLKSRKKKTRTPATESAASGEPSSVEVEPSLSPRELLDAAKTENEAEVEGELLARVRMLDWKEFERLVVKLLEKMGYGAHGRVEHTGRPNDRGMDGIISQDPLGLDRIFVQAKAYNDGRTVDRPAIHQFAGALDDAKGDRGVFITTSTFSRGAQEFADRAAKRIELIDGDRLSSLMFKYGVGTQPDGDPVTLHALDEDFFDTI